MSLRTAVLQLQHAIQDAERLGVVSIEPAPSSITDFKQRKQEAIKGTITGLIKQVIRQAPGNTAASSLQGTQNISEMRAIIDKLTDHIAEEPVTTQTSVSEHQIPSDIKGELMLDIAEMHRCMETGCYRSAIILCGRILETTLHRKYFDVTGNDLLEKSPGIGLGNLIAKLSERGIELDPGLSNQIHLINQVRIHSVHKKRTPFKPSPSQTQAIILYTMDVIKKILR